MTAERKSDTRTDTRQELLEAAAALISDAPGQDVPLRAICDRVGVKLPTLYHFFGSKDGLLEAVIDHGFETYLARKRDAEPTGDPIEDLRRGWDTHVRFGLDHAGFYALMYGQVTRIVVPPQRRLPTLPSSSCAGRRTRRAASRSPPRRRRTTCSPPTSA